MIDRMQIALALGIEALGIEVSGENYRDICSVVFLAKERGVYITDKDLYYSKKQEIVISRAIRGSYGASSENLLTDVMEIQKEYASGSDQIKKWKLDDRSMAILNGLRRDIERKGIRELVESYRN